MGSGGCYELNLQLQQHYRHVGVVAIILLWSSVGVAVVASSSGEGDSGERGVGVSVYYEALCPYCANFIVNSLVKVFQLQLDSIIHLKLIPWGNAWLQHDASIACQHGPDECLLNTIEACAIALFPDVKRHFRFIHCVERLNLEGRHGEWASCLGESGLGNSPIDCYNSGNGYTFERRYGDETGRLNPPHRFVPWVVVNNQALQEDFPNFLTYICKAYRGSHLPEACRSLLLEQERQDYFSFKEQQFENLVCYNNNGESSNNVTVSHRQ